jgi:hypothetical protein
MEASNIHNQLAERKLKNDSVFFILFFLGPCFTRNLDIMNFQGKRSVPHNIMRLEAENDVGAG